ncbi:serine/threonine-protein kinase [Rhizobium mayense]|uniref:Serine/threonine-protein kinase n=2 Tax=Rhizobium mayense TaxID=1312184 RepID=A0ABT7JR65_9HYPH|nr:serine/threonine-protein kinase [Rhizobium mayense]
MFVTGKLTYDGLVSRLAAEVGSGEAGAAGVRDAISNAATVGMLPLDIADILLKLLPAVAAGRSKDPEAGKGVTASLAAGEDMFDEPTVPLLRHAESPVEPAANPPKQSSEKIPPLPSSYMNLAGHGAAPPQYSDVQSKVDDVVLSALVKDYRGLRGDRQSADAASKAGRPDALDGLLVNYKSARFRSDARRAVSGNARGGLELGKMDGFNGQRAGVGAILRDRFILDAEIGRGGMGIVYSAVDRRRLEAGAGAPYVALKLLNDEFRNNSDALRVLEAEARKAQSLAHPNIATVYDFDRDRSEIFIVMELLTGRPLSRLLASTTGEAMPGGKIVSILKGICAGLAYAHQNGVVHSDLKPGNIFVGDDNGVKLLDFGLATAGSSGGFDVQSLNALTTSYASPEMFAGAIRDPRDDIFALGCIAYQLLTGVHPFLMQPSNQVAAQKIEPEPIADLDPAAWAVIAGALCFEREGRIGSVEEFEKGLFEM